MPPTIHIDTGAAAMNDTIANTNGNGIDRRSFMTGAAAFTVVGASLAGGTQANTKVKLGVIGCGGRGTWIADLF